MTIVKLREERILSLLIQMLYEIALFLAIYKAINTGF